MGLLLRQTSTRQHGITSQKIVTAERTYKSDSESYCKDELVSAVCLWLYSLVGPSALCQFLDRFYAVGRTSWTEDQPAARPLPTQDNTTQNKRLEWD
jgi:hypothetical protein